MALFNDVLKRVRTEIDCLSCPYYDSKEKACKGLGIVCNEFDEVTQTIIDTTTGLPRKIKEKE